MGISEANLNQILNNSRKLCNTKADKMLNQYSNGGGMGDPDPMSFSDFDDSMYLADDTPKNTNTAPRQSSAAMKNPILAEVAKNPIETESALDRIAKKAPQKKPIIEERQSFTAPNPGIDYSIIRAIVKECIDEKMKENNALNENALQSIKLSGGKIRLTDNSGKVFEAKLEYVGKIKTKTDNE